MYEAKYSKYITKNSARFAEPEEIKSFCEPIGKNLESGACGVPLYYEDGTLYVDNSDVHYLIKGSTSCKKTRVQAFNLVNSIIDAGESFVVNDPKGELYKETAAHAEANNYNIQVLNLRNIEKSNGWNPLSLAYDLNMAGKTAEAQQIVNDIAEAIVAPAKETTNDIYWANMSETVLDASALLLMDSVPRKYFNISNVIQLTNECNTPTLRYVLDLMNPTSCAATLMHGYLDLSAEKTLSCIYSTLKASLIPFVQNDALLGLLCRDEIRFSDLANKKTAFYIIYPDEKETLCFLIVLFLVQCYQVLIAEAAKEKDGRLKNRVNFILDEFSNLPEIKNFNNMISESRGRNIRYFVFTQSLSQLKYKYKEIADTIKANCDWIVFPSKEIEFLEKISSLCGKVYDYRGRERPLVSVEDIQHLKKFRDGAEVLVVKNGQYPFVSKVPDYEYIDVFADYPTADLDDVTASDFPAFFSFTEWTDGFGKIFNIPYPKNKRLPGQDLRLSN